VCPMGCCPTALQQPGRAKKKCTRAYGCYVPPTQALATNEVNRLNIGKSVCSADATTGHADQIEWGTSFKRGRRQDTQSAVAGCRKQALRD
jgi:hypothetical protein